MENEYTRTAIEEKGNTAVSDLESILQSTRGLDLGGTPRMTDASPDAGSRVSRGRQKHVT